MLHIVRGLRALGEAVLWGLVGGGLYCLVLGLVLGELPEDGDVVWLFVIVGVVVGLLAGVVVGCVGLGVVMLMSAFGAAPTNGGRLTARVVSAVTTGALVFVTCWYLLAGNEFLGGPESANEWFMMVIAPGLVAAAVAAWRAPAILATRLPVGANEAPPPVAASD